MSNDFWSLCLASFQKELPAQQFTAWIKSLRLESNGPNSLRLLAPNRFVLQWVRERYLARIENQLREFRPDITSILAGQSVPVVAVKRQLFAINARVGPLKRLFYTRGLMRLCVLAAWREKYNTQRRQERQELLYRFVCR